MRWARAGAVVVSCGLWSVVCPRRVCPYSAVCCGNEIANRAASFFSPCWAVYGNTGFAGDSCRLGEERSRECKPTCTVSARRSLSALPPRYSRRVQRNLGLWGLRWCAALGAGRVQRADTAVIMQARPGPAGSQGFAQRLMAVIIVLLTSTTADASGL